MKSTLLKNIDIFSSWYCNYLESIF